MREKGNETLQQDDQAGVLRISGAGLAGASLPWVAGCGGGSGSSEASASDGMWNQFSRMTLNFISENTAPTSTIAANLRSFKELTGINVNVLQLELQTLVQKIALDIGSGVGSYQIIYADPYQVLAPFHAALGPHARRGHWRVKAMRLLKKGRGSATRPRGG